MTLLSTREIRADLARWERFPEEAPTQPDLLPLRWALSRIESFTATEANEWLGAVVRIGDEGNCHCAAIVQLLIVTLRALLGERGASDFLDGWGKQHPPRESELK